MDAIVCDTSSLIRLYKCQSLPLIAVGFVHVYIPAEVWDECFPELRDALLENGYLRMQPVPDIVAKHGKGERAMLNLALERHIENVLTDDDKAISEARRRALRALTTLDLLVLAKLLGAQVSIKHAVATMREKNEGIDENKYQRALQDAGESP